MPRQCGFDGTETDVTYFRDNIQAMSPYVPGEQPPPGAAVIKLNTNENPYPPSPAALRALRELDGEQLRRYPHPYAESFRQVVGKVLGVPAGWVMPGNGSDDLLTMIFRACVEPGRKVVYPMPTYVLYRTLARIQNAPAVEVPFDEDYQLPVDALAGAGGAVTLVASPNSPSGTGFSIELLEELAARVAGLLVIDEAYADFADSTALELAKCCRNVIVLRTLSKGYSLAGLRLGFGVANRALLAGLDKVKDSYNVDAVACAVGAAAFADQAWKTANARKVQASRAHLAADLAGLDYRVWPSQANFLLVRPPRGDAAEVYQTLKAQGILVRYFQEPRLDDKLRITVGTDEQNAALVAAMENPIT